VSDKLGRFFKEPQTLYVNYVFKNKFYDKIAVSNSPHQYSEEVQLTKKKLITWHEKH